MRALPLLVLALLVTGCAAPPQGSAGPDQPRRLTFSPMEDCASRQATELSVVVNDRAGFEELWRTSCTGGVEPPPPAPFVDFARSSVVASFWGEKRTGGFGVQVADITEKGDQVTITVDRRAPSRDCNVAQVVSYPAALVVSDKVTKRATFTFHDSEGC